MLKLVKKAYMALFIILTFGINNVCSYAQPLYGDADHSGILTAYDSSAVLNHTLNPASSGFTEEDVFYCDVDGNGIITANDASTILSKVLNSSFVFPVEIGTSGGSLEHSTEVTTKTTTETTTKSTTETTTEATTESSTEASTEATTLSPTAGLTKDGCINVGSTTYGIGQAESSLQTAERTGIAPDGINWHSYCSDNSHYTKVGTANGKVVQIVTYDTDASYDGIKIGSPVSGYSTSPAKLMKNSTDIKIYFDTNNGNKVYAIQLNDPYYLVKNQDFSGAKLSELERQIFDMTNAFRAQNGVGCLRWSDDVAAVARAHAQDMAINGYFSHTNLEGKKVGNYVDSKGNTVIGRLESAGLRYYAYGENIDAGYYTAEAAMDGWINSQKGHRENLLGTDFSYLGVGAAFNEGDAMGYKTRFVQNFYTPVS